MPAKSFLEIGNEVGQAAILILGAPFLSGLHQVIQAKLSRKQAPPLFREYRELWRSLRKESAVIEGASLLTRWAPFGIFGAAIFSALLVPLFSPTPIGGLGGDLLVVFGLWLLTRVWLSLSALESQNPNTSLGAGRSLSALVFTLPALLLSWLAVLGPQGTTAPNFVEVPEPGTPWNIAITLTNLLALAAFSMVVFLEVSSGFLRVELERAYGGRLLGLLRYSSQLWRVLWYALLSTYFLPPSLGSVTLLSAGVSLAKLLALVVVYAVLEARAPKARFFRLHEFAALAIGLAFLANAASAIGGQP